MTEPHPTPAPKMPEHLSTNKPATTKEEKIDRQMEDGSSMLREAQPC